jgi:hypothetical protein
MLFITSCNSDIDRLSVLKKCTVLADESIVYARAHYVKLFYHFNPNKFSDSYKQIGDFDAVTHKNIINTYNRAINKVLLDERVSADIFSQNLLSSCQSLSEFSILFVEQNYRLAINHMTKNDPLTDEFFNEINQIVKFDHNIGSFDKTEMSFKRSVDSYQQAVRDYIKQFRKDIPSEFVTQLGFK